MGLELKPSKTRLAHTLEQHEQEKPGFDFLGFKIQQFPVGKYHSKRGFKTIITPGKNKQKVHYEQIANVIEAHKVERILTIIGNFYTDIATTQRPPQMAVLATNPAAIVPSLSSPKDLRKSRING